MWFCENCISGEMCFSDYRPKCSLPIRLQDFVNFNISKTIWGNISKTIWGNISKTIWGIMFILCTLMAMEALVKSCKIFVGCDQACPVCPNDKEPRFPKRVELFYLFVAFSYRSMKARALSCSFTWVLYGMPRVTNCQYL